MAARTTETQTVRAQAKWVRTSARKARVVTDHIRGRSVPEARAVLAFTQRAAAREIEKVLAAAVANAEANHGLVGDELIVQTAVVDEGPTLKRWRARARGRVARIKKRSCHITVTLAPGEAPAVPPKEKRRAKKVETTVEEKPRRSARPRAKSKPASERKPKASARSN
jgi:large subunit ribosomal protein L22